MRTYDITVTMEDDGEMLVHRPDCPVVALHRAAGRPLCTMFNCSQPPPPASHFHSCWKTTDD